MQLKAMLDKSSQYVLAEGMYFLDKSQSSSNFLELFHCLSEVV